VDRGNWIVSLLIIATAGHVFYHHRERDEFRRPAMLLLTLLAVQLTLGALTVLSGKQYVINSLHVVTGAAVLGTSVVLALRAFRPRFTRILSASSEFRNPADSMPDARPHIAAPRGARA
jgi:heme A synthase